MNRRALLLFALASVAWGVPYLFVKLVLEDFGATFAVWARAVLGAAVLVPLVARRGLLAQLRGRWGRLAWLALLDLTAPTLLVTLGVDAIPSSLAGTLVAAVPVLVALLALRFDVTERAPGLRLVGLLVGIAGVGVLLGVEVSGDARALVGALCVLAGAASYAGGALYYKRHFAHVPAPAVVAGALVACAAMTTVPALFDLPSTVPSALSVASLAVLGIGCTAGGYLAFYGLIGRVGAGRAAIITYVAPTIAVAAGVVFLDEPLTAAVVAGGLLILVGSWLSTGGGPPRIAVRWRLARTSRDPAPPLDFEACRPATSPWTRPAKRSPT